MGGTCITMPRFFIKSSDIINDRVFISGDDFQHIKKVLRLQVKDSVWLSDGKGTDYFSEIHSYQEQSVCLKIQEKHTNTSEPSVEVTLFQGLPKAEKFEVIIQKCVELGISRIVPVRMKRCVVNMEEQQAKKKVERWQKISLEAAKQSKRGKVPSIEMPITFQKAIEECKNFELKLFAYENHSERNLRAVLTKNHTNNVAIFIGPEGGFAEEEIELAIQQNLIPISLGPRILRTETAGFALLAVVMYEMGNL